MPSGILASRPFPRRIALTDIGCVFHRVRRDCLEDSAAAAGDAESLLHHIDPLIVIDLERGLGVQRLVRATRSESSTDSEFLAFDCRSDRATVARFRRSRQLPARPGKSAQTDRNRRIT